MTLSAQPDSHEQPALPGLLRPVTPLDRRQAWRWCALLALVLGVVYAALQNGRWVPVSDAEYYLAIARNLATGQGYQFNGRPVDLVPPGWPLFLAGMLELTSRFAVLNLLPLGFLLGGAVVWYWILLRFVPPPRAFVATFLGCTLFWWYHSTVLLHSEGLFCLLLAWAVLLALDISESRPGLWRVGLLVVLCAAMIAVRWAGLAAWIVIGAALLGRQTRPAWNRQWVAFGLSLLATCASFYCLRYLMRWVLPDTSAANLPTGPGILASIAPAGYLTRAAFAGQWLTTLLWMPAEVAVASRAIALIVNLIGWALGGLTVLGLLFSGRFRQWIWCAALLYSLSLVLRWESPNARYLIPIAPLLVLGFWLGWDGLAARVPGAVCRTLCRRGAHAILLSIGLCNLALIAVDIAVAHSPDFYGVYYAGQAKGVIAAAQYLNDRSAGDNELAISPYYSNLNRDRVSGFARRSLVLLTGRCHRSVPQRISQGTQQDLIAWAGQQHPPVRFYLHHPPVSPWRVWHFRMGWLQRMVSGRDVPTNPFWELYELKDGQMVRIDLPETPDWPDRVPGLEPPSSVLE